MLAGLSWMMGRNEKVEKSNWIPRTITTVDKFSQQIRMNRKLVLLMTDFEIVIKC